MPTVVNAPPMYTVPAVGPGRMAFTAPLTVGANDELIWLVVASNAKMNFRSTAVPVPVLTPVNGPPTIMVLPTCSIAAGCLLLIHGVPGAGSAPTTSLAAVTAASVVPGEAAAGAFGASPTMPMATALNALMSNRDLIMGTPLSDRCLMTCRA